MFSEKKNERFKNRGVKQVLNTLQNSSKSHTILVYPDIRTMREVYSKYLRFNNEKNKIVVLLPYYETVESVRNYLLMETGGDYTFPENMNASLPGGSLFIYDSYAIFNKPKINQMSKSWSHSEDNLHVLDFLHRTVSNAEDLNKESVELWADMGSFFHSTLGIKNLLEYEQISPKIFKDTILKQFCMYHQKDFERNLKEKQQNNVVNDHLKNIIMMDA
jgi:hypothetical protein